MDMRSVKHQVLAQEWKQRILEQQGSGLSVRSWCAEQNIRESRYYYWLQNLRGEELVMSQPEGVFAQVQLANSHTETITSATSGICAVIRSRDLCLEIHNGADPQTLAAAMRALGVQRQ